MFPDARCRFFVAKDGCVVGSTIGHDVMDSSCQGFDGAIDVAGAFVVDALSFDATLLIGYSHCGFCCLQKFVEW